MAQARTRLGSGFVCEFRLVTIGGRLLAVFVVGFDGYLYLGGLLYRGAALTTGAAGDGAPEFLLGERGVGVGVEFLERGLELFAQGQTMGVRLGKDGRALTTDMKGTAAARSTIKSVCGF